MLSNHTNIIIDSSDKSRGPLNAKFGTFETFFKTLKFFNVIQNCYKEANASKIIKNQNFNSIKLFSYPECSDF